MIGDSKSYSSSEEEVSLHPNIISPKLDSKVKIVRRTTNQPIPYVLGHDSAGLCNEV